MEKETQGDVNMVIFEGMKKNEKLSKKTKIQLVKNNWKYFGLASFPSLDGKKTHHVAWWTNSKSQYDRMKKGKIWDATIKSSYVNEKGKLRKVM